MARTSYGTSRVTASRNDVIFRPMSALDTKKGVVYAHGSGGNALSSKSGQQQRILEGLADQGFTIVAADLGAAPRQNWGNAEHVAAIADCVTYLLDTLDTPGGSVHLVGTSMGHVGCLNYALANPTDIASITGFLPAYDLQAIRDDNGNGDRAQIDTAWGVVYPAALPAGANPADDITDLVGIPWRGWYSSDDAASFVDGATDLQTILGGTLTNLGAVGHSDASLAGVAIADMATFLVENDS